MPDSITYVDGDPELPIISVSLLSVTTTPIVTSVCMDTISYLVTWDGLTVAELNDAAPSNRMLDESNVPIRIVS